MVEGVKESFMKYIVFCIILLVQLILTSSAFAKQFQISCKFERDKDKVVSDLDARDWYESYDFSKMEFLVRVDSEDRNKFFYDQEPDTFFGYPTITSDEKEISINWFIKAKPLNRHPSILMKINRYSGESWRFYNMLDKPNGTVYSYWLQNGKCEINEKKI